MHLTSLFCLIIYTAHMLRRTRQGVSIFSTCGPPRSLVARANHTPPSSPAPLHSHPLNLLFALPPDLLAATSNLSISQHHWPMSSSVRASAPQTSNIHQTVSSSHFWSGPSRSLPSRPSWVSLSISQLDNIAALSLIPVLLTHLALVPAFYHSLLHLFSSPSFLGDFNKCS